jgi:all-trans-retinol 13,14-reductase
MTIQAVNSATSSQSCSLDQPDYLIVGSGLSALVFGALMANAGKRVHILEAHEYSGGFGHTFTMAKKYHFNAQLHYVWDCGEGNTVHRVLKRLGLDREVTFERYDPNGFDHMRMPGYKLDVPSEPEALIQRLSEQFPEDNEKIRRFIHTVQQVRQGLKCLSPPIQPRQVVQNITAVLTAIRYLKSTLQDVFDRFHLPKAAQTLLALQWPDFLLPPEQLSFYAWVILFTGYQEGAFYPTQHFEHVINSLVKIIQDQGGQVKLNQEVVQFIAEGDKVMGVRSINRLNQSTQESRQNDW